MRRQSFIEEHDARQKQWNRFFNIYLAGAGCLAFTFIGATFLIVMGLAILVIKAVIGS